MGVRGGREAEQGTDSCSHGHEGSCVDYLNVEPVGLGIYVNI